jgi:predicted nucleotidyltransferase
MDQKYAFKIIDKYINRLVLNKINIQSAYLFGSFAKGTFHKDSDIDLALVFDEIENIFETEVMLMTFRKDDETIIEPHIFKKSDFVNRNPYVDEILNTGIKIL